MANQYPSLTPKQIALHAGGTYTLDSLFTYGLAGDPYVYVVGFINSENFGYTVAGGGYSDYFHYYSFTMQGSDPAFADSFGHSQPFSSGTIHIDDNWTGSITLSFSFNGGYYNNGVAWWAGTIANGGGTFPVDPSLFTTNGNEVNFNSLNPAQNAAIIAGADLYLGLGGDDVVSLPSIANYNKSLGNGSTLSWSSSQTFNTASRVGDTYIVNGSDGSYKIALGAGSDTVAINGNGNSTITAGGGKATITINGTGTNTIRLGSDVADITLSGNNNNIEFLSSAAETAILHVSAGFRENVNGFSTGDTIDLRGLGDLTLSAGVDRFGAPVAGEVDLYTLQGNFIGALLFNPSVDYRLLKPVKDGAGGTKIIVDAAPGPQDPAGNQIDWSFIHRWESPGGSTVLRPYISTGLSGLTMAQGVDVGDQGNNGTNLISQTFPDWASNPNLMFISSFVGKSHDDAMALLKPVAKIGGNPSSLSVSLTTTQANALTLATETKIYNQIKVDYTAKAATYGKGGWDTLTANQQTGIVDLAYNFGVDRFEALKCWALLAQHRWNDAVVGTSDATGIYFLGGPSRTKGAADRRIEDGALILDGIAGAGNAAHLQTGTQVANKTVYSFSVASSADYYAIDPLGSYLTLTSETGSPKVASLTLPLMNDAARYLVSFEIGSTWSPPAPYDPGDVIDFGSSGVDGIRIVLLDSNGQLLSYEEEFTFYVKFATLGNFAGAVSATPPTQLGTGHHDLRTFNAASTDYTLSITENGVLVKGFEYVEAFKQVEFLRFSDKTIFLETADNANIARLYSAALGRPPDVAGLSGWEDIYANNISSAAKAGGVYSSLAQTNDGYGTSIAGGFTQSIEFQSKYGLLDDTQFVTQLYQNVLDRAPEQSGLIGWLNLMHNNGFTRDMVLVGFAESPENIAKTAADWLIQI